MLLRGEGGGLFRTANDRALHELHHVEGRAGDFLVVAVADHRRNRDTGAVERGDDAYFTPHVMGGTKRLAEGWPAQNPPRSPLVSDQVGEVGHPSVDLLVVERRLQVGDPFPEPLLQRPLRNPIGLRAHAQRL